MKEPRQVLRETDDEAVALARTLIRSARYGALATLQPVTANPLASRVAVATDADGAPIVLTSGLAGHTAAMLADPRCSLLVGEPGKGDPLAHPRVSIECKARRIEESAPDSERISRRYLSRHPKAKLYAGFADFSFFRLEPASASLNGGFARAYRLEKEHLLVPPDLAADIAEIEPSAIRHMNDDHADAIALMARHFARSKTRGWRMTGLDADGLDLARGDRVCRVEFHARIESKINIQSKIVKLVRNLHPNG